jgi:hypothetical protein
MIPFIPPTNQASAFNCLHCNAYANQTWGTGFQNAGGNLTQTSGLQISICTNCHNSALWMKEAMVYPALSTAPLPNPDLPSDIATDYREARDILQRSPRGAAALLRLAIQKLCKQVGESGENLNHDIGELVKKGLRTHVQQALDVVRVIGNNAVHPGQIDLNDDSAIAVALFGLVNLIVQQMITDPKEAEALYNTLPATQRAAIEKRDSK